MEVELIHRMRPPLGQGGCGWTHSLLSIQRINNTFIVYKGNLLWRSNLSAECVRLSAMRGAVGGFPPRGSTP